MSSKRESTPEQRAQAVTADIRGHLAFGDTRRAVWRGRNAVEAELAALAGEDPPRAMLLAAAVAGSLAAIASTLSLQQPPRPPGYLGGPPSAADLLAAYEMARGQTLGR